MDKVIIDGIDVSECVCFATAQGVATVNGILVKDIDNACTVKQKPCEDIKNCMFKKHYKQLQRLKVENEQLKTKIFRFESKQDSMCEQNKELIEDNLNLSKENERLKIENKELELSLVSQASKIFTLEKSSNDLSQGINKLYQALQEIRDIADGMHDWWINKTQYTDVYELAEHLLKTELNRIIDKINEVIGAE